MVSISILLSCNSSKDSSEESKSVPQIESSEGPLTDQPVTDPDAEKAVEPPPDEVKRIAKKFNLVNAFPTLKFGRVTDIQNASDGTDRLFIAQQEGVISLVKKDPFNPTTSLFLDLKDKVLYDKGELGLLGLAFHPEYKKNGYFYVHYSAPDPMRGIISRFSVDKENPDTADPGSEMKILEIPQPDPIHNGGHIAFGPNDGYLYITLGDGGPGGGAGAKSQDPSNLFGSILRIDVDNPVKGLKYGIPPDNPFKGNDRGFREEIYAYGLRNPYSLTFDPYTGLLLAGDVGQSKREELDIIRAGLNYGWPVMEGSICYDPPEDCDTGGLEPPVYDYDRSQGGTVILGVVYSGNELPGLQRSLIYSDFVSGQKVWAIDFDGEKAVNNRLLAYKRGGMNDLIISLGTDENNELYLGTYAGKILKLEPVYSTENE